jgi:uncharacterized repeat protein (TIGR03806 family)
MITACGIRIPVLIPGLAGILFLSLIACTDEVAPQQERLYDKLSGYSFFKEPMASLVPREGVIPYDLNTPLFSDYAEKQRFVYVPKGKQIPYDTTGVLRFPVGSILIKNFLYTLPSGERKIVETRLLINESTGWIAEVYEWNEAQTEAVRIITGKVESITFIKNNLVVTTNYQIPNKNQCKGCHAFGNKIIPIGPKVGNLNREYQYSNGNENQLNKWAADGILQQPIGNIPRWPASSDSTQNLARRARTYLEVNCGHCHGRQGAASNTGLYLQYDNDDSLSYGFYKTPVAAGLGSGDLMYDIVPGHAEQSIMYHRMNSISVEVRMPELGRNLIDEKGVALIKEWIDKM